jgi:hypothetical protein
MSLELGALILNFTLFFMRKRQTKGRKRNRIFGIIGVLPINCSTMISWFS